MSELDSYEAGWHDIARLFDDESHDAVQTAADVVDAPAKHDTPPFDTVREAQAFRFRFYKWRTALRRAESAAGQPLYVNLHRLNVSIVRTPAGRWVVRFALPEASAAARVLAAMTQPHRD